MASVSKTQKVREITLIQVIFSWQRVRGCQKVNVQRFFGIYKLEIQLRTRYFKQFRFSCQLEPGSATHFYPFTQSSMFKDVEDHPGTRIRGELAHR